MSKRIVRGWYKVKTADGGWRSGTLVAGQRVKLQEGDWLEWLECQQPLQINHPDGLVLFRVSQPLPSAIRFFPFEIMSTFDVRRTR